MAFTGATAGLAAGAQTNDTRMDFALEATYATPPSGNYQALRITGESFSRGQTTAHPEEINTLKQVSQSVVTQVSASGTISGALSSSTFDDLIAGVMGDDWKSQTVSGSAPALNSNSPIWKSATIYYLTSPFTPGEYICFRFIDPDNNLDFVGFGLVVDAGTISFDKSQLPANYSDSLAISKNSTLTINCLTNGSLDKTFTIRKKLLGQFLLYPGSLITQLQIQLQQAQFGTVSIDVTSANETMSAQDIATTVLPAPGGDVHNSVNNFLGATVFGNAPAGCVTQFTCTIGRDGSANDYGMGHADACGVRTGQFTASGSIEFYFRSWDEYQACIAGTQG